ncbi:WXG100 family type VII secretion target [Paenibacillus sp. FSL M8-0334]|uniref:WXG100 family type VII secretion target n=1 Tax=Paenibacillus campinasensis TaxID=66347 RepID=A0ABW9SUN3_9BACL|nr:WXG100 family type VII secretion target [Paenibacillus campinasensis]MUG64690.1 WXG100 family type VII secretion target [Paenibacillus campinasensis]
MTRIRVTPQLLNEQGVQLSAIASEVQQLQERVQQRIQGMAWESRHRAQVEQRLAQCRAACQAVVTRLEQNRTQLVNKASVFAQTDQSTGNSLAFGKQALVHVSPHTLLQSSYAQGNNRAQSSKPPVTAAGVEFDALAPFGGGASMWAASPIAAAGTLLGTATASGTMYKYWDMYRKGFGVWLSKDHRGRTRANISNGFLANIRKKSYAEHNWKNHPRIPKYVLPSAAVKDSLSWKGGKLGYAGIALTTVGNFASNIKNKENGAKIAGDAVVDVGVGVGTVVASAAAGAKAGALIGTAVGGPIGTLAGAAIGFGVSVGASYVMNGIKFADVDGDGQKDSVTDTLKIGAEKLGSTIAGWFK